MKFKFWSSLIVLALASPVQGQGTFVYDQQSSDESNISGSISIQVDKPGQSFTPTLNTVGFIRLAVQDFNSGNSLGATLFVNLRANSITGAVLSASSPVFLPDTFNGVTNFFFSTPVSVTPGTTYFFEPLVQSGGDLWEISMYHYAYPGGTAYESGIPLNGALDLWFREGVVPEPSSLSLVLLGIGVFAYRRRSTRNQSRCFNPANSKKISESRESL